MKLERAQSDSELRQVREAWLLAHPRFPRTRPNLFQALSMGLVQAAQSWHVHAATSEGDCKRTKQIIVTECTNAALVSALFITCTVGPVFDVDGMPSNGMAEQHGLTNLYYSFFVLSSFLFAMSIIYAITLLIIVESLEDRDVVDFAHALGQGIHWPLHNFIAGVLLLLGALLFKGFFDVSLWTWIVGVVVILLILSLYFGFLAVSVQAQWDIMYKNSAKRNDKVDTAQGGETEEKKDDNEKQHEARKSDGDARCSSSDVQATLLQPPLKPFEPMAVSTAWCESAGAMSAASYSAE